MATVWKVLTVLATLALSASAYLDPNYKYLFWTEMNVNNLQPGTTNTADVVKIFFLFSFFFFFFLDDLFFTLHQ